jgi:hypothetical protein
MKHAWERLENETPQAFAAFCEYLKLGSTRSIDAAFEVANLGQKWSARTDGRAPSSWFGWAERFDWVARSQAHDDYLLEVELRAREDAARAQANLWAARESEVREQGFRVARELLDRSQAMLEFPLTEETETISEDGTQVTRIIHPARWNLATAAKFLDTAYRTASLSAGMETERILRSIEVKNQNAAILQAVKESLAEVINDDAIFVKVLERLEQKIANLDRQYPPTP